VALIVVAWIALQATNATVVSIMSLFVTTTLGLNGSGPDSRLESPPHSRSASYC
jgi:hypothetical protein